MIILYGGSFDPVHIGHLIAANEVYAQFKPSRFIFMPAKRSPLKHGPAATDHHRLSMLCRAVEQLSFGEVSTIEMERTGISYTYDTVKRLMAEDSEIKVVIGSDQYEQLNEWHRIDELRSICQFIVVNRQQERQLVSGNDLTVQIPRIDISSTEIRRRLNIGQTTKFWLPDSVAEYIRKEHLYEEKESD